MYVILELCSVLCVKNIWSDKYFAHVHVLYAILLRPQIMQKCPCNESFEIYSMYTCIYSCQRHKCFCTCRSHFCLKMYLSGLFQPSRPFQSPLSLSFHLFIMVLYSQLGSFILLLKGKEYPYLTKVDFRRFSFLPSRDNVVEAWNLVQSLLERGISLTSCLKQRYLYTAVGPKRIRMRKTKI